tara:strand:- start:1141 stop:1698 length:558 start_codon:yes stop_codon:yes gene_type:complete
MKTMLLFLFLLLGMGVMQAQKVTQLGEVRLGFNSNAVVKNSDLNSVSFSVKESYKGEFSKNPIEFMKQNFDFSSFVLAMPNARDYDEFLVTFNSEKGYLEAIYTDKGKLVQTHQKFIDKLLPLEVSRQVFTNYQGWKMVSNKYVASGKSDKIDKEYYKIKMENGDKTKSIKVVPGATIVLSVVHN